MSSVLNEWWPPLIERICIHTCNAWCTPQFFRQSYFHTQNIFFLFQKLIKDFPAPSEVFDCSEINWYPHIPPTKWQQSSHHLLLIQQLLFQYSVPVLRKFLRTFLRPIPADIESPEKKDPISSPGSEIIQRPLRLNMTTASDIMLFNPSDMMLRRICFWRFHQKVGQKIIR